MSNHGFSLTLWVTIVKVCDWWWFLFQKEHFSFSFYIICLTCTREQTSRKPWKRNCLLLNFLQINLNSPNIRFSSENKRFQQCKLSMFPGVTWFNIPQRCKSSRRSIRLGSFHRSLSFSIRAYPYWPLPWWYVSSWSHSCHNLICQWFALPSAEFIGMPCNTATTFKTQPPCLSCSNRSSGSWGVFTAMSMKTGEAKFNLARCFSSRQSSENSLQWHFFVWFFFRNVYIYSPWLLEQQRFLFKQQNRFVSSAIFQY